MARPLARGIGVGLAATACVAALAQPASFDQTTNTYTMTDGQACGPIGDARSVKAMNLNRLKNRFAPPRAADVRPAVTLASMLAPGDDFSRFDVATAASVVGYVVDVKKGGDETCNCHEVGADDRDTHIELALTPEAAETERVVVEVTPRLRLLEGQRGVDWRTATLASAGPRGIKGRWVRVTGWMLFDDAHIGEAENTSPGHPGNWRATCWELHPVTRIEVLPVPPPAAPRPNGRFAFNGPTTLAALQRRYRVSLTPRERALQQQRNAAVLSKYYPGEIDRDDDPR